MKNDAMSWVENVPEGKSRYFKLVEGDNRIQLLSHLERYLLKWNGSRYVPADDGDANVSVKGVGWVLQDGMIKDATLPYTVVKSIRGLMNDQDYAFEEFPMPRQINIKTKNAGTKEAEYTVVPSPKESPVSAEVLKELAQKPKPEELVAQLRSKDNFADKSEEEIDPSQIPF